MRILTFALSATLAGCVTTTAVTPVGRDTYMMGTDAIGGFQSRTELTQRTIVAANAYCDSLGKKMQMQTSNESGARGWSPLSSQVVFQCLDESDPAYQRPNVTNK